MSPATGATGKPMSYLFSIRPFTGAVHQATLTPDEDCPHTTKTFKNGAWSCKRCGNTL